MQIVSTICACKKALSIAHDNMNSVAFVPTMGNLHAGHIHLVEMAKQYAKFVVVSIFVNPLQFGVNEDLSPYPRTLNEDIEKLKAAGVDLVFTPSVEEMYPDFDGKALNQTMMITPPPFAKLYCGVSRPRHFDGVATVVIKLFNIVFFNSSAPQFAVFGKKDFQQLAIIRELVRQFNMPIDIVAAETMREASGLAMSSRNGYLTTAQKTQAAELQALLKNIQQQILTGNKDYKKLETDAAQSLNASGWVTDYIAICNASTLQPASVKDSALLVLAAAKLGTTRLIDNIDFLR